MGGFNVNLPGFQFNMTREQIDAARAAQGLPPVPAPPDVLLPPVPAPPDVPVPLPPVASPASDPTIIQSPVQAFAGSPEPMDERSSIGEGVGAFLLNERFGQNIPVEPRVPVPAPAPAPAPAFAAPVVDQGIGALTADDFAASGIPGLEGFDPANPLNPVKASGAPPADDSYTPPDVAGPAFVGTPPIGYQGGGGEYDPRDGFTEEDRLAEEAFYSQQRPAPQERAEPVAPAPEPIEAPPEDYTEIPVVDDTEDTESAPAPEQATQPEILPYQPVPSAVSDDQPVILPYQPVQSSVPDDQPVILSYQPASPVSTIQPVSMRFGGVPGGMQPTYTPASQQMVDQILLEEQAANPFMNPYLRSGPFAGG